ncbi:GHMP kinase [Flavobacterium sp. F372]|uniref:GHMP kinase n=1 Tax=Flavobacterium bernardetii TaxID=2813823 RepID=A0ABR7J0W0_9FLAO|nr:GYDIA family GHMP kinase [Flavobacterium bernardetii]MBC5835676.1 GHMP kinase [Flavobacterium bernardetii]NHF71040.1 GHMP kinase [Flavobacterium bernardetii]
MTNKFYSNGKLLITGEYLVLNGAKALALPTKFGQSLTVSSLVEKKIFWTSFDTDKSIWFETELSFEDIVLRKDFEEEHAIKHTLVEILHQANLQNPNFLTSETGYKIETELTFPRNWGLGTSSTLINNIAQWLQIDAFELLRKSFGGSGYDIACAQHNSAITYQLNAEEKPIVEVVDFTPNYTGNIFFVYLNKKQNSRHAIKNYMNKQQFLTKKTATISEITNRMVLSPNFEITTGLLDHHEIILSDILELETVKERLFPDFKGTIKSLGAWGGDFVMVLSKENPTHYFTSKGYDTILTYEEMILI